MEVHGLKMRIGCDAAIQNFQVVRYLQLDAYGYHTINIAKLSFNNTTSRNFSFKHASPWSILFTFCIINK